VVRVGGRDQAARFTREEHEEHGDTRPIATGMVLVQRALEDRAE
jgi:hypothetical protein